jgi:hypothetical protein
MFILSYDVTINTFHHFLASGWTKIAGVTGLKNFQLGGVGVLRFHLTTMCI